MNIKEVDYASPFPELKIGSVMDYTGTYFNPQKRVEEVQTGTSPVKRIYVEMTMVSRKSNVRWEEDKAPVWAELENEKLIFLGFDEVQKGFIDGQKWRSKLVQS